MLLAQVQQQLVAEQATTHAAFRPDCRSCGGTSHVKDWAPHRIATLFGEVRLKLPRFLCTGCGCGATGVSWPSHCRSTPELNQLQARLSALMPFRVAADLLQHLLPIDAGRSPETLRSHTLRVGKQLVDEAAEKPPAAAAAITISLDSTFVRSCEGGERHLEVRVGNVEMVDGARQVFGAVARTETDLTASIQRTLETVGRTDTTEVTAFTDGCPGLRAVLANAGVRKPPILDWFHIAIRLQHTKLAAANLLTDDPNRVAAKVVIVAEVERLHWRIWNGKAKNAQRSIKRIRKVMHVFKSERSQGVASRKLWHALHAVDKYLRGQAAWLVNYAKRYRAGLRVGTSITEGTANFLVNRRMNKSQQMRWSRT
ncbi:MAG: ISKra4 family transposase, partial [Rhodopila sp.]